MVDDRDMRRSPRTNEGWRNQTRQGIPLEGPHDECADLR